MRFTGNGITNCYPDEVDNFISITVLSHEPLRQIPPGAICVHGHLHEGTEPTVRHINLTVEQTLYRPVRLARVVEQAREREWTISNNRR